MTTWIDRSSYLQEIRVIFAAEQRLKVNVVGSSVLWVNS